MSYELSVMEDLVGKVVTGLEISTDQMILVVSHDSGKSFYVTGSDCCSETWIADIVGVSNLIGQRVLKTENVEVPYVDDGRCRQDVDEFYGVKLTTTRGYVDIVYRCSSNGNYGGALYLVEESDTYVPYGTVAEADLIRITDDFSA